MRAISSTQRHGDKALGASLAFPASLIVLGVILIPVLMLFRYSLNRIEMSSMVSDFTLAHYSVLLSDAYYQDVFLNTAYVSVVCTVLALILGFPVAYFLAKTQSRYKSLLIILLIFPMMVGGVVRAAGWMVVLGNAGVVNHILQWTGLIDQPLQLIYTPFAVIIGTTGVVLPYLVLVLQSVLEGIDFSIEEAAYNLGAGFFTVFWRVILPVAIPGVAAGTILVFILCMNAYATPVLLGGTGITMMAPAIYDQITKASHWPFGATLAFVLVVTTLIMALFSNWFIHRRYIKTMTA